MKTVLTLLFITLSVSVFAQTDTKNIHWGKEIKLDPYATVYSAIGLCNGKLLALRKENSDVIEAFDPQTLENTGKFKVNNKFNGEKINALEYFIFGDRLMMLGSHRNNAEKSTAYCLNEIGGDGTINSSVDLASFEIPAVILATQGNIDRAFDTGINTVKHRLSDDGKQLLVTYYTDLSGTAAETMYHAKVIGQDLKVAYATDLKIPVANFRVEDVSISGSGRLQLAGYGVVSGEKEDTWVRKDGYFFSYNLADGNDMFRLELEENTRAIGVKTVGGETIVYGVYADGTSGIGDGTFILKLDSENTVLFQQRDAYDFAAGKIFSTMDKGIHDLSVKDIAIGSNGNYTVVIEERQRYRVSGNGYSTWYSDFGQIFVFGFSSSGKTSWTTTVTRKAAGSFRMNNSQSCYTVFTANDLSVIYNDPLPVKNRKESPVEVNKSVIDASGNAETMNLAVVEDFMKRGIVIDDIVALSPSELIVFVRSSMEAGRFARLTL